MDANRVWVTDKKKHKGMKTKVSKKTNKPDWNENFEFFLDAVDCMTFEVWDKEKMMGSVSIKPPVTTTITGGWFNIRSPEEQTVGEIRLNFSWEGITFEPLTLKFNTFIQVFEWIKTYGLEVEGIFRVSGLEVTVQELLNQLIEHAQADYEDERDLNFPPPKSSEMVHSVCGAFKLYLRLSLPLIPEDYAHQLLELTELDHHLEEIKMIIASLPPVLKNILTVFVGFLTEVVKKSHLNKMDGKNLSVIFSPSIFHSNDITIDMIKIHKEQEVIQVFLRHFEVIFGESAVSLTMEEEKNLHLKTDAIEHYQVFKRKSNVRRENVKAIASRTTAPDEKKVVRSYSNPAKSTSLPKLDQATLDLLMADSIKEQEVSPETPRNVDISVSLQNLQNTIKEKELRDRPRTHFQSKARHTTKRTSPPPSLPPSLSVPTSPVVSSSSSSAKPIPSSQTQKNLNTSATIVISPSQSPSNTKKRSKRRTIATPHRGCDELSAMIAQYSLSSSDQSLVLSSETKEINALKSNVKDLQAQVYELNEVVKVMNKKIGDLEERLKISEENNLELQTSLQHLQNTNVQ